MSSLDSLTMSSLDYLVWLVDRYKEIGVFDSRFAYLLDEMSIRELEDLYKRVFRRNPRKDYQAETKDYTD